MRRQACEFNGFGYVNNRGSSRYWGVVAKSIDSGGVAFYVCLNGDDGKLNIHNHLTEEENAWIAASFYEFPKEDHGIARAITSRSGKVEYRINSHGSLRIHSTQFGTSSFTLTPTGNMSVAGGDDDLQLVGAAWSSESIQALHNLATIGCDDESVDTNYWELVEKVAKISKDRLTK